MILLPMIPGNRAVGEELLDRKGVINRANKVFPNGESVNDLRQFVNDPDQFGPFFRMISRRPGSDSAILPGRQAMKRT